MNLIPRVSHYLFALTMVLCLPFSSQAQSSISSHTIVDSLVKEMALKQQLSEAPENIQQQFEQNPLQLPAKKNKLLLQQFADAYATNLLLRDFKAAMRQELTDRYRQELAQWFNSTEGQRITDARQFYYTLQGKRQRVIARYEMDQNPPSEERITLIGTLTDTTSIAESSVESSVIILRSIIKATSQLSKQRSFSDAQINAIVNNFQTRMQAAAGEQINRQHLVMYHGLQNDTLRKYIAFWGTDTGQWLDKAINQSMKSAYQQAADRFLNSMN